MKKIINKIQISSNKRIKKQNNKIISKFLKIKINYNNNNNKNFKKKFKNKIKLSQ